MKTFEPCRVQIDLDLPETDSCESRLVDARNLLHLLDEKVLGYMSVLYEGDGGKVDLADAQARFKVRFKSEVTAIVEARVVYLDGYPDRDSTHVVGIVVDKNYLASSRDKAIGWWRENLEGFDNVERVVALVSIVDERGTVGACDLTAEQVIFENGKEK